MADNLEEKQWREKLQEMVDSSSRIVFFGGAGVSTESGIPDFRSRDGLFQQKYKYRPQRILSRTFYNRHPDIFYDFYRERMLYLDAQPNIAHRKLAEMEAAGKLTAVITQNIDGLHQKAGSKNVLEIHGSVHRNYCRICGKVYDAAYMKHTSGVPVCSCGGEIKPDVVLYEERLKTELMREAERYIREADMIIIAGTSLAVYPAARLVRYYKGLKRVLINRDPTGMEQIAQLVIHDSIGKVMGQIKVEGMEQEAPEQAAQEQKA